MIVPPSVAPGQEHTPPEQVVPGAHGRPQPPQLFGSVIGSMQLELAPAGQESSTMPAPFFGQAQTLFRHEAPVGQAFVHDPQCAGSLDGSTHAVPQMKAQTSGAPTSGGGAT
jgi:hypothetical protein